MKLHYRDYDNANDEMTDRISSVRILITKQSGGLAKNRETLPSQLKCVVDVQSIVCTSPNI